MSLTLKSKSYGHLLLGIVLSLSAFTHLWNPAGFPDLSFDEGVYMRRAMSILDGLGVQERYFYDHPYFGQIFLAATLGITGFPDSLDVTKDAQSLESLYAVPRVIMGLLAVLDTFLVYKIAERRYDRKVALIAAVLFAVLPITWLLRRILLDSILLPFLLSSVLLALYAKDSPNRTMLTVFSGILLGTAIFTKAPAFTMIPLIGFLIYTNSNRNYRNWKHLGLWMIPVILIPLIWPAYSVAVGQFDLWQDDVLWQAQRRSSGGFYEIAEYFFLFDPIMFALGSAGLVYAAVRRDVFLLLFSIPMLIFMSLIGFSQYFHWIPLLPVFSIAGSKLIADSGKIVNKTRIKSVLPYALILVIGGFGLFNTSLLVTADMTSAQFEAMAFVADYSEGDNDLTILASPVYSWVYRDVFDQEHVFYDYADVLFQPIETNRSLLIVDRHFLVDLSRGEELEEVYNGSRTIASFEGQVVDYDTSQYPYKNLYVNDEGSQIEVRIR